MAYVYRPLLQKSRDDDIVDLDLDDNLFCDLGSVWEIFKHGDYDAAFAPLYILACKNNPKAQFLMGIYYENGLGEILKSLRDAAEFYTRVIVNNEHEHTFYLRKKAEDRLYHVITIQSSKCHY